MTSNRITRRKMLGRSVAGLTAVGLLPAWELLAAESRKPRFKIGACDWSLGHRGKLTALEVGKQIGLDGVEVCIPGTQGDFRDAHTREQYVEQSNRLGIEISSLAVGMLHEVPYASDPRAEGYLRECIEVTSKVGRKVLLLPFFAKGDIKGRPDLQREVGRRLKRVAPQAEKAGVIVGLETNLNAVEHMRILDAAASPAVQVYYDTSNMHEQGYDIYKEIRQLGRRRICQFHCKEKGALLGNGQIDFRKVRKAIDDIGYRGWLVLEGSLVKGKSRIECYRDNREFLQKTFLPPLPTAIPAT